VLIIACNVFCIFSACVCFLQCGLICFGICLFVIVGRRFVSKLLSLFCDACSNKQWLRG